MLNNLPKGIRLHQTGKLIADITINGKRYTKTFTDIAKAVNWRNTMQSAQRIETKAKAWTLSEAIKTTEKIRWQGLSCLKTCKACTSDFINFFGTDILLQDIDLPAIDTFIEYLKGKGNKQSTIALKLSVLSTVFTVAEDRNGIPDIKRKPKIPCKQPKEHRIRFITDTEEKELLRLLNKLAYFEQAQAVKILLYTGMRSKELRALQIRDIDLTNNIITLYETKNGHNRAIPIIPAIQDLCKSLTQNRVTTETIFPDYTYVEWLERPWNKVKELMGLKDDRQFTPHCLRHTCATRLSQSGVSLAVIRQWLGHTNIRTTVRYAHFNQADLQHAADCLNRTHIASV